MRLIIRKSRLNISSSITNIRNIMNDTINHINHVLSAASHEVFMPESLLSVTTRESSALVQKMFAHVTAAS